MSVSLVPHRASANFSMRTRSAQKRLLIVLASIRQVHDVNAGAPVTVGRCVPAFQGMGACGACGITLFP